MEQRNRATNASIRMGEMAVAADGERLRTLLGSCIGLALYDRRQRIGGLAHIVLPYARGETDRPGKFVNTAVPTLIEQMKRLAGARLNLTAKIAGGASMFGGNGPLQMGVANVDAVTALLEANHLSIENEHTGGEKGRRVTFDCRTGELLVDVVGHDTIIL